MALLLAAATLAHWATDCSRLSTAFHSPTKCQGPEEARYVHVVDDAVHVFWPVARRLSQVLALPLEGLPHPGLPAPASAGEQLPAGYAASTDVKVVEIPLGRMLSSSDQLRHREDSLTQYETIDGIDDFSFILP